MPSERITKIIVISVIIFIVVLFILSLTSESEEKEGFSFSSFFGWGNDEEEAKKAEQETKEAEKEKIIEDLRVKISENTTRSTDNNSKIAKLNEVIDKLDQSLSTLTKDTSTMEKIDKLNTLHEEISEAVTKVQEQLNIIETAEYQSKIDELMAVDNDIKNTIETLKKDLKNVPTSKEITKVSNDLKTFRTATNETLGILQTHVNNTADIPGNIENLDQKLQELRDKVDGIKNYDNSIKTINGDVTANTNNINNLSNKLDAQEKNIIDIQQAITELKNVNFEINEEDIAAFEGIFEQQNAMIDQMMLQTKGTSSSLEARVKYLEDNSAIEILKKAYPVGSIYLSFQNTNPKNILGFGTWEQIKDRFLYPSSGEANKTGGSNSYSLTVGQLPGHGHGYSGSTSNTEVKHNHGHNFSIAAVGGHSHNVNGNTGENGDHQHNVSGNTGGGGDHSHGININTNATGGHGHSWTGHFAQGHFKTLVRGDGWADGVFRVSRGQHGNGFKGNSDDDELDYEWNYTPSGTIGAVGNHQHNVSGNTGGGGSHYHGININTNILGKHAHGININTNSTGGHTHTINGEISEAKTSHGHTFSGNTSNTGSGQAINNMPQYVTCFAWKRTA